MIDNTKLWPDNFSKAEVGCKLYKACADGIRPLTIKKISEDDFGCTVYQFKEQYTPLTVEIGFESSLTIYDEGIGARCGKHNSHAIILPVVYSTSSNLARQDLYTALNEIKNWFHRYEPRYTISMKEAPDWF